jgi:hypothetical protein
MYAYPHNTQETALAPKVAEPFLRNSNIDDLKRRMVPLVRRTIRRGLADSPFDRLVFDVIDQVGERYVDAAPPTDSAYFDEVLDGVCTTIAHHAGGRLPRSLAALETVLA